MKESIGAIRYRLISDEVTFEIQIQFYLSVCHSRIANLLTLGADRESEM